MMLQVIPTMAVGETFQPKSVEVGTGNCLMLGNNHDESHYLANIYVGGHRGR